MLDRLQDSFARQRDFLFDTSHELKTPLTTMRLAVDEICADNGENLPPYARRNLRRLRNQVLRMERLVKDFLNLSSLETLTGIDPKPVLVTELLSSLANEYRFLADAHKVKIDVRLPDRLVTQGDAEKLNRAFSNILDNALKYNVDGGRIEVTGDQSGVELTITVSNTGPGVPEDEIPKVFGQFYRVEKSRSIQHGGTGLGLAIVKRIVELHGGTVRFESRPEAWTRVTVHLPGQRGMWSSPGSMDCWPPLQELEDWHSRIGLRLEPMAVEELAFQRCEEAPAHGVVVAVAGRSHRGAHGEPPFLRPAPPRGAPRYEGARCVFACHGEIYVYTVEFRKEVRHRCARVAEWQTRRI